MQWVIQAVLMINEGFGPRHPTTELEGITGHLVSVGVGVGGSGHTRHSPRHDKEVIFLPRALFPKGHAV